MPLPSSEVIADLKQKHGEVFFAEFGDEAIDGASLLFRKPSMPEVDAYFLSTMHGNAQEGSNNLVFAVRLWPGVEPLQAAFDDAPAVVADCAKSILGPVGGDDPTLAGLTFPGELSALPDDDRAALESRTGMKVADLEASHPRGSLRWFTLPGVGVSIFRRPTRSAYAAFADARGKDEMMVACRDLCAECAITDAKGLAGVFASYPATTLPLAFALAALAGAHLKVRSGKL